MKLYLSGEKIGVSIVEKDIEEAFGKFGKLAQVWVARQPPGFAFLEFENSQDGEAALRDTKNKELFGCIMSVEDSGGKGSGKGTGTSSGGSGGGDRSSHAGSGLGRGRSSDRGSTRSDGGSGRSQEGRDRSYGDHCGSGTRRHDEQRRSNDRTLPPERPRSRPNNIRNRSRSRSRDRLLPRYNIRSRSRSRDRNRDYGRSRNRDRSRSRSREFIRGK